MAVRAVGRLWGRTEAWGGAWFNRQPERDPKLLPRQGDRSSREGGVPRGCACLQEVGAGTSEGLPKP